MTTDTSEQDALVSGIGKSEVGRRLNRSGMDLTAEACIEAIEDAGLARNDIDGLTTYPGGNPDSNDGFSGPGSPAVQDALRLELDYHRGGAEGAAQLSAVLDAVMAVATGLARHVLVYRTVTEATADANSGHSAMAPDGEGNRVGGNWSWLLPFGAYSAVNWTALYCQRYMHEYGLTREQLAQIPLTQRSNAALNEDAVYQEPMSLEEYLDARMISTPLCMYDCDVPSDGSTAFVISHQDFAPEMSNPPIQFEALGSARNGRPLWNQHYDMTTMAGRDAAEHMWSRTDLGPEDVDTAQLYDGFSWMTIMWLEAMGFCDKGEAGSFIENGTRISLDGELPLNTSGGQLSEGRLHGFGHLYEAVLQLRGQADNRQISNGPDVAAVSNGGGNLAGCVLLRRFH